MSPCIQVVDNDDGSYDCRFVAGNEPEYMGCTVYMVSVTLGGEHAVGSPFAHTAGGSFVIENKQ